MKMMFLTEKIFSKYGTLSRATGTELCLNFTEYGTENTGSSIFEN